MGQLMSLGCTWYINRHHQLRLTSFLFTVSEVPVIGHGQKIKIKAFFGLSNGYRSSQIYVLQEYSHSDTTPGFARADPKI